MGERLLGFDEARQRAHKCPACGCGGTGRAQFYRRYAEPDRIGGRPRLRWTCCDCDYTFYSDFADPDAMRLPREP